MNFQLRVHKSAILTGALLLVSFISVAQEAQERRHGFPNSIEGLIVVDRDRHPTVQSAIDEAASKGGGVVLVPSGKYVERQIILRVGVSLAGMGMDMRVKGRGTILEQSPGANTDFIVSDTNLKPTDFQHWSTISNLCLTGNKVNTSGSGIRINTRTGEGFRLEHLLIQNFAESAVTISRGAEPFEANDLHMFRNGKYGIDITRTPGDINQLIKLSLMSGDDNGIALIHIERSGGASTPETYLIEGVKAEKRTPGKQNNVILLENMQGSPVVIMAVGAINISHEPADAVVRVNGTWARLSYMGLSHDANYTYTINDTARHKTFTKSFTGFYGADFVPDEGGGKGNDQNRSPDRMKHAHTAVCTTEDSKCTTQITWKPSFPDSNYTATCSIENPSGNPVSPIIKSKMPAGLTVAIHGDAAPQSVLDCIAIHD